VPNAPPIPSPWSGPEIMYGGYKSWSFSLYNVWDFSPYQHTQAKHEWKFSSCTINKVHKFSSWQFLLSGLSSKPLNK
jgi:hypothetical protein